MEKENKKPCQKYVISYVKKTYNSDKQLTSVTVKYVPEKATKQ